MIKETEERMEMNRSSLSGRSSFRHSMCAWMMISDNFSIEMMLMLCHSHLMLSNGIVGRSKSKWATKCNNFGNFNNFTSTLTVAEDNQDEIPQKHKHSRNWLCDCANGKNGSSGLTIGYVNFCLCSGKSFKIGQTWPMNFKAVSKSPLPMK